MSTIEHIGAKPGNLVW